MEDRNVILDTYKRWLKEGDILNTFDKQTRCYISCVEKYPCGSQHSHYGIEHFTKLFEKFSYLEILLCNNVIRIHSDSAWQSCVLIYRYLNEGDYDEVVALNVNSWHKENGVWKIKEFRWDCMLQPKKAIEGMYFETEALKYYPGIHLPVISGELDNPWHRIKEDAEKTVETQVTETISRYAFGIDTLNIALCDDALSEDIIVNMAPWGAMDKREFMQTLKFNRQSNRYWAHPVMIESLEIHENKAFVKAYRMAGHKQKIMAAPADPEHVFADARYEFELKKEDEWRITKLDYLLGILEWERDENAIWVRKQDEAV